MAKKVIYSSEDLAVAREYFEAHPDETLVYVCYGGRVVGERQIARECSTRTGQLVVIATLGFPMAISRNIAVEAKP
jgi:hypothetical protein